MKTASEPLAVQPPSRRRYEGLLRFSQRWRIHIQLVDRNHFNVLEALLQRGQELLRIADDDDARIVATEVCGGELPDVGRGDGLYAADVAVDLVEAQAVQRERADAADDAGVRLELASETADEHGLARSELGI